MFSIIVIVDNSGVWYYYIFVIVTFKDKETGKLWNGNYSKRFQKSIQKIMRRKLILLHGSINLHDLRLPPGNRLHALGWENENAYDVEVVDYHS